MCCRGEAAARSWAINDELAAPDTRPAVIIMSEVIYNQSGDSLYDDDFHDTLVRISRMLWYLLYYSYITRLHHYLSYFTILWFVSHIFFGISYITLTLLAYITISHISRYSGS